MRARSQKTDGYEIYAVSGTNTISFAINSNEADTKGLLGFAIERLNYQTGERKYIEGYKVFPEIIPNPTIDTVANTYSHPIQSFVWDDFACTDDTEYEYFFHPLKGTPKNLDRSASPVTLRIKTEVLFSNGEHDVFFNRGVASSQAYRRKFFNLTPDKITNPEMKQEALNWLSRHLDDAIIKFIRNAKEGDTLLGCFYEFHYEPIVAEFRKAIDRKVNVKIIIDAKENEYIDKDNKFHESFPRVANLETLNKVGIPASKHIIKREAKKDDIQHNKFIVLIDSKDSATEVWTGSLNISMGGVHGQTNVGHWIRNKEVARKYEQYWNILSKDPGSRDGDDKVSVKQKNGDFCKQVEELQPNFVFTSVNDIPLGITPVFSPRRGESMLENYTKLFDSAKDLSCITLAFGINSMFKDLLMDNTNTNHISFMLLEKEDKPKANSTKPFRYIGAKENVYKAFGAYIEDDMYRWTRETTTRHMKLNQHVAYIHSKFLLVDPLGKDPIVVAGSANFSKASTNDNDENMVIIRGNKRVADIYFTEFNRLFFHYYFRSVYKKVSEDGKQDNNELILLSDDTWLEKYQVGKFRYKRVEMFTKMQGF